VISNESGVVPETGSLVIARVCRLCAANEKKSYSLPWLQHVAMIGRRVQCCDFQPCQLANMGFPRRRW
jgi:hypothetical protein